MTYIWTGLLVCSIIFGVLTNRMDAVSVALVGESQTAVTLVFGLLGGMCFWSGMMKLIQATGLNDTIAFFIAPMMKVLFDEKSMGEKTKSFVAMNLTANLLGLGNASTPLGLLAMKEMDRENKNPIFSSKNMIVFIVLNTASIQLIPTTAAMIRGNHGSSAPFAILPAVLVTSFVSVCVGLLAGWIVEGCSQLKTRVKGKMIK